MSRESACDRTRAPRTSPRCDAGLEVTALVRCLQVRPPQGGGCCHVQQQITARSLACSHSQNAASRQLQRLGSARRISGSRAVGRSTGRPLLLDGHLARSVDPSAWSVPGRRLVAWPPLLAAASAGLSRRLPGSASAGCPHAGRNRRLIGQTRHQRMGTGDRVHTQTTDWHRRPGESRMTALTVPTSRCAVLSCPLASKCNEALFWLSSQIILSDICCVSIPFRSFSSAATRCVRVVFLTGDFSFCWCTFSSRGPRAPAPSSTGPLLPLPGGVVFFAVCVPVAPSLRAQSTASPAAADRRESASELRPGDRIGGCTSDPTCALAIHH
jgi:hypothetical protein